MVGARLTARRIQPPRFRPLVKPEAWNYRAKCPRSSRLWGASDARKTRGDPRISRLLARKPLDIGWQADDYRTFGLGGRAWPFERSALISLSISLTLRPYLTTEPCWSTRISEGIVMIPISFASRLSRPPGS